MSDVSPMTDGDRRNVYKRFLECLQTYIGSKTIIGIDECGFDNRLTTPVLRKNIPALHTYIENAKLTCPSVLAR